MTATLKRMPKRFLEDAPAEVYDIFDNGGKTHDRYDVFLSPEQGFIYLTAYSESGSFYHDELPVMQFRGYRDRVRKTRIAWNELPEVIRKHVLYEIEEGKQWAAMNDI